MPTLQQQQKAPAAQDYRTGGYDGAGDASEHQARHHAEAARQGHGPGPLREAEAAIRRLDSVTMEPEDFVDAET